MMGLMNYIMVKLRVVFSKFSLCRRGRGRRVMLLWSLLCDAFRIEIILWVVEMVYFPVLIQIAMHVYKICVYVYSLHSMSLKYSLKCSMINEQFMFIFAKLMRTFLVFPFLSFRLNCVEFRKRFSIHAKLL